MDERRFKEALDKHITGNYGEDQIEPDEIELTPEQKKIQEEWEEECYLEYLKTKED